MDNNLQIHKNLFLDEYNTIFNKGDFFRQSNLEKCKINTNKL